MVQRSGLGVFGSAIKVGGLLTVANVAALLMTGCGPDLEYGAYEGSFSGQSSYFDGSTASYSSSTLMDFAYDKSRGTLTYELSLCEGFVAYHSSSPCYNTITLSDTTDGLIGSQEETWSLVTDSGDVCQGTESISVAGDIDNSTSAALELTYHLNIESASTDGCVAAMADIPARIVATGTVSHIE